VPRTLIVTNDFPPRRGGIQSFVHALATGLPAGTVTVYAPAWKGAAEFDARQPFPVIRHPTSLMLPVPAVSRRAAAIAREHGCDTVLFGAAAPLGLITPALRKAGVRRAVALTHGHEAGWAALPGARSLLRHEYPLTPGVFRALGVSRPEVVVVSGWSTFASQAAVAWCRARRRCRGRLAGRRAEGGRVAPGARAPAARVRAPPRP